MSSLLALSRALQLATIVMHLLQIKLLWLSTEQENLAQRACSPLYLLWLRGRVIKQVKDLLQLPRQKSRCSNFALFLSLVNEDLTGVCKHVYIFFLLFSSLPPVSDGSEQSLYRCNWASLQSELTSGKSAVEALERKILDCEICDTVTYILGAQTA